jgi:hypothetical protein
MKKVIVVSWEKLAELSAAELLQLTEKLNQKLHSPADFLDQGPVLTPAAKASQQIVRLISKSAWTDDPRRN